MKKKPQSTKATQPRSSKKPVKKQAKSSISANAKKATDAAGDIINLILRDHMPLKALIKVLKDADVERAKKSSSVEKFIPLLLGHATAEEQSLYVEMKEFEDLRMESFEGDTEHGIAAQLVQEINATPDDDEWNAKVKVLAELVEHHIEEEEGEMFADIKKQLDANTRLKVGEEYSRIKNEFDALNAEPVQKKRNSAEHRVN